MNTWRLMTDVDLLHVLQIAAQVHTTYPEDEAVFAERMRLYPAGCRVLVVEGRVTGYVISHPWRLHEPPALNSLLGSLPTKPDTYYLHDLAVLPEARGAGAGAAVIEILAEQARAEKLMTMSLVAVHRSVEFWQRHGFVVVNDPMLAVKLQSYDQEARFMARALL